MKLTNRALDAIRNNTVLRMRLGVLLSVGEQTIRNYIADNADNGDLTRVGTINIISEETGLAMDQILTEEKTTA